MYYSGITFFKKMHDITNISSCFLFSCVEMPTVISDIILTVLVNIKILFLLFNILYFFNTFFLILSFKEVRVKF